MRHIAEGLNIWDQSMMFTGWKALLCQDVSSPHTNLRISTNPIKPQQIFFLFDRTWQTEFTVYRKRPRITKILSKKPSTPQNPKIKVREFALSGIRLFPDGVYLNIKGKTITFLEAPWVEYLHYLGVGKGVLNQEQKELIMKENADMSKYIKSKNLCSSKHTKYKNTVN